MDNDLYLFFHLPKTGGSTIRDAIKSKLPEEECEVIMFSGNTCEKTEAYIQSFSEEKKRKLKFICGHYLSADLKKYFPKRVVKFATFLRNPTATSLSNYNYELTKFERGEQLADSNKGRLFKEGKALEYKDWLLNKQNQNRETRWLYNFFYHVNPNVDYIELNESIIEDLKEKMKIFDFIGITELKKDYEDFLGWFGVAYKQEVRNPSKNFITYNDINFIKNNNSYDLEIYNYVLSKRGIDISGASHI